MRSLKTEKDSIKNTGLNLLNRAHLIERYNLAQDESVQLSIPNDYFKLKMHQKFTMLDLPGIDDN